MKKIILLIFISSLYEFSRAQSCSHFPADCPPDFASIQDSETCISNFIMSREITMQNHIRNLVTEQMEKIAESRKWEVYEYDESAFGIFVKPANENEKAYPLPFNLRGPHIYILSFIFIVNNDSLKAWRDWFDTELRNRATHITDSYTQVLNDPSFQETEKKYMDSADYWSTRKATFMTAHIDEYQKALLSKDQNEIKKFEDANKQYDDRANYWIGKATSKNTETTLGSEKSNSGFQAYKLAKTQAYRNSSIIRIKFKFNAGDDIASEMGNLIPVKQLAVSGSTVARQFHNAQPREDAIYDLDQYSRCTDLAFVLFGSWDLNPDQYKRYRASYTLDKKNTDKVTPKTTASDKVQTITLHVEGSPDYIGEFLKSLDFVSLTSLL